MEYFGENGFLEELVTLRSSDSLEGIVPMPMSECYNNGWNTDYSTYGGNPINATSITVPFEDHCSLHIEPQILIDPSFGEFMTPSNDAILSTKELTDNLHNTTNIYTSSLLIPSQEDQKLFTSIEGDDCEEILSIMKQVGQPKVEQVENVMQSSSTEGVVEAATLFNVGVSNSERNNKSKKLNGQPSKNLMAERRRRKRLNDRLSMLRSIVPKISKMDRTSILGDTIDYIKELLERVNKGQQKMDPEGSNHQQATLMTDFKDVQSNEILSMKSPKFVVERKEVDTWLEICCATKPGLLLSTLTALEASGLEIEQCVISCFSDFSMQASCNEEAHGRGMLTSEDIKHALFRNAGYGGRCPQRTKYS